MLERHWDEDAEDYLRAFDDDLDGALGLLVGDLVAHSVVLRRGGVGALEGGRVDRGRLFLGNSRRRRSALGGG
jgi:hypothetical protein